MKAWAPEPGVVVIAVVAYPGMCCAQDLAALQHEPGVQLRWVQQPLQLGGAHLVVLPDAGDSAAALQWMRQQRLDAVVVAHAQSGGRVLGLGGGVPMLAEALIDLQRVQGNVPGLGLLPVVTLCAPPAQTACAGHLGAPVALTLQGLRSGWAALNGLALQVQPALRGQTHWRADMQAGQAQPATEVVPHLAWQSGQGNVWGCCWHGMWADAALRHAVCAMLRAS